MTKSTQILITIFPVYYLFVLILFVILNALYINSAMAIDQAAERFCFIHVGPEDKPMPEFCVVTHDSYIDNSMRPQIIISKRAFDTIFQICMDPGAHETRIINGLYTAKLDSNQLSQTVGPYTILKVTEIIRKDRLVENMPMPDVIIRLRYRLGVAIDPSIK